MVLALITLLLINAHKAVDFYLTLVLLTHPPMHRKYQTLCMYMYAANYILAVTADPEVVSGAPFLAALHGRSTSRGEARPSSSVYLYLFSCCLYIAGVPLSTRTTIMCCCQVYKVINNLDCIHFDSYYFMVLTYLNLLDLIAYRYFVLLRTLMLFFC